MIVRRIDLAGDFTFGAGKNDYLTNNKAVGQSIATRLRSFLGDCFFDTEAGLDWFTLLGSKNQSGTILAQKMTILNTRDVTQLVELSSVLLPNRSFRTTYSATTVYSTEEPLTNTVEIP